MSQLSLPINQFSLDLLRELKREAKTGENLLYSPLSLSIALNMLLLGSRNETKKQIVDTLKLSRAFENTDLVHAAFQELMATHFKSGSRVYSLLFANRALIGKSISSGADSFKSELTQYYEAPVDEVNFKTDGEAIKRDVNQWVEKQTNGKIKTILDEVDPQTVLILFNAIYFKGKWMNQFKPQLTKDMEFNNNGNETEKQSVPFMVRTDKFKNCEIQVNGKKGQMVELPYEGEVSMFLVVPEDVDGLSQLLEGLTLKDLDNGIEAMTESKIVLFFPKFKFETEYELNRSLQQMGIKDAFIEGKADLSRINSEAYVSKVIHKAVIEVNEEGTEAAAVTKVAANARCMAFNPEIVVDRPFLFFVRQKASQIYVFMGVVNKL